MSFTPNHDDWIDKNIFALSVTAYGLFKLYGRCAVLLIMPSNFGIAADASATEVQIGVRRLRRTRVQAAIARLLRLEDPVEEVIQAYDPEREIAFEVRYPNGRCFAWCHTITPSPAEAFAHCDNQMREQGSSAFALVGQGVLTTSVTI